MTKTSIKSIIRANKRTIEQNRRHKLDYNKEVVAVGGVNISVSVMGVVHSQTISDLQIKDSFRKALDFNGSKL